MIWDWGYKNCKIKINKLKNSGPNPTKRVKKGLMAYYITGAFFIFQKLSKQSL